MKTIKSFSVPLIFITVVISGFCMRGESGSLSIPDDNGGLTLPAGFSALVVADKLGSGRHIVVNSNGDIYLALRSLKNGKGIVALRDSDNNGRADIIHYFGNTLTTGIDISDGFLYYSNFEEVLRVPLSNGELVPTGTPVVIATGI